MKKNGTGSGTGPVATVIWLLIGLLLGSGFILLLAVGSASWLVQHFDSGTASSNLSGWVQAVGAVIAIVAGFVVTVWQMSRQRVEAVALERASSEAALLLARDALDGVTERLEAALDPKDLALRGARTDELVAALREFDMARMPSAMLPDFNRLRSCTAAVNARLAEIYNSEKAPDYTGKVRQRDERKVRLKSAVRQRNDAATYYVRLQAIASTKYKVEPYPLAAAPRVAAATRG